ncbi:hypothetical protein [Burkholderia ambifaria]|uniref:Lipoprotein n=1 Tax=Burkholderia ambifaria MEX-5 TaxID=396597 RepID=B1SYE5_9BURK|nr:hypothetical protein [Burkholderia ambifaria]EDT43674.1 hypothetical protein BamMEX5DRAFT_0561 [Burkholderia ambifaria MEX-5]
MLKFIAVMFILAVFASGSSAEISTLIFEKDGHVFEAKVASGERANSVSFYQDGKPLRTYENLIVNQSSLSSNLIPIIGGGIALEIESNGSRNKYTIIAPIEFVDGKLYVECLGKSVYDSIEEVRSVGSICRKQELGQFDVSSSINEDGLFYYTADLGWLKNLSSGICQNAVGFDVGSYRIARCAREEASDTNHQKIIVLNWQNRLLFSIVGYELVPVNNKSEFMLSANLKNGIVVFKGDFSCYEDRGDTFDAGGAAAEIDGNHIDYSIRAIGACLVGNYKYKKINGDILLKGRVAGAEYYLLGMDADLASNGVFVLNRIKGGIRGFWVEAPPKRSHVVNGK